MKTKILLLFLFVSFSLVNANNNTIALFEEAKNEYAKGNFEKALEKYTAIDQLNYQSFELYYNMGNCFYKTNKTAEAIQYYSKALKLEPNNSDAITNLKFAYLKTRDKIEPKEELFLNRWWKSIYNLTNSNTWAWFSLLSFFIFTLLLAGFFVAITESKRKLFFFSGLILLVISAASLLFAWQQYQFISNNSSAVIMEDSASIKSSPTDNATNLFVLHEGTVVSIVEQNENWVRIKLDNEKEGWISEKELGFI